LLTEDQVRLFHRDGYLRGGRILDDNDVAVLQEEVLRVIRDKDDPSKPQPVMIANLSREGAPVWQIVNIWQASDNFRQLISNSTVVEEMAQLTKAKLLRIWHDQIVYKPATEGGVTVWHQDAPLWPILTPMTEITAWVALDDVDPENGCMSMVPGSHLWGDNMQFLSTFRSLDDIPADFDGHPIEVRACPVKRGEVHYHHALTWHSSQSNRSARPRRAIALHFMTDETRYCATGGHIMKPFVTVQDGEVMEGEFFPTVWES